MASDDPRFHIILMGSRTADEDPATAAERLAHTFKIDISVAQRLLSAHEPVIKKNVDEKTARAFSNVVDRAGFRCRVEPMPPSLEMVETPASLFTCPKCGHSCPIAASDTPVDICPACQVIVSKYLERRNGSRLAASGEENGRSAALSAVVEDAPIPSEEDAPVRESVLPLGFFKVIKWGLVLIGGWIAVQTGISVFEIQNHEVLYHLHAGDKICVDDPLAKHHPELSAYIADRPEAMAEDPANVCIKSLKLHLINSGRKTQPQTVVRLRLSPDIQTAMAGDLAILDFNRTPRPGVQTLVRGDLTHYALGPLKPADQVYFRFKLIMNRQEDVGWGEIFEKLDIAKGDPMATDSPRLALITRILLGFFGVFDRSAKDLIEEAGDIFLESADDEGRALSQSFTSASADLAVRIEDDGYLRRDGDPSAQKYRITIRVDNHGPAEANGVSLSYRLPDSVSAKNIGLEIDGYRPKISEIIEESRGKWDGSRLPKECTAENREVTCTFDSLLPRKSARLYLSILDTRPGTGVFHATVVSDREDGDTSNNQAVFRLSGE